MSVVEDVVAFRKRRRLPFTAPDSGAMALKLARDDADKAAADQDRRMLVDLDPILFGGSVC